MLILWYDSFRLYSSPLKNLKSRNNYDMSSCSLNYIIVKISLKRHRTYRCIARWFFSFWIYVYLLLFSPFILSNIPSTMIEMNACQLSRVHHVERCSKSNILNVKERQMWRNCEIIKLWTQHFHNNFITMLRCHAVNDR